MKAKIQTTIDAGNNCLTFSIGRAGHIAMIDFKDLPILDKYTWHVHQSEAKTTHYLRTRIVKRGTLRSIKNVYQRESFFMHRLIMAPIPDGMTVDHLNGNGLDNRRMNLEIVTIGENARRAQVRKRKDSIGFD
jgi:hypothetical protein